MLSLPDFREKQILFVRVSDVQLDKLRFNNENICWTNDGDIENQLSCYKVLALFVIGNCSITSVLIRNCRKMGVSLFLMKDNFELYAKVLSMADGNYLLRQKQYAAMPKDELAMARQLIVNKIQNQSALLDKNKHATAKKELRGYWVKAERVESHKELLGIEGSASRLFFAAYFFECNWRRRLPRTKFDSVNTLLDIGYTLLFNLADALLALFGFDNYKGFYHKLYFQRRSLACDIMEPFRCIIDKQIIKSKHLGQIDEKDFRIIHGRYELDYSKQSKYLKIFAGALMERKEEIYCYVRQFYHHILTGEKEFPVFDI
jgi:CRISPR-associated protein Cas1